MTNEELLRTPKNLLTSLDAQRKYVLQRFSVPWNCPACHMPSTAVEASGKALNDFDARNATNTEQFHCPGCKRELKHYLTIFGDEGWTLSDDEAAKLRSTT